MNIIFDLDGVIADSSSAYVAAIRESFSKRGYDFSPEKIRGSIFPDSLIWVDDLLPKEIEGRDDLLHEIVKDVRKNVVNEIGEVKLQKNVENLLNNVSSKNELFLITNSCRALTMAILEKYNLMRFFRKIITRDDGFGSKENAMKHMIEENEIRINELVYIGDTSKDVDWARKVGCKVIIIYTPISWNYGKFENIKNAKPDMIVENLKDLEKALEGWLWN